MTNPQEFFFETYLIIKILKNTRKTIQDLFGTAQFRLACLLPYISHITSKESALVFDYHALAQQDT